VKELISNLSPTATIYEVAERAKCSHCDTRGVADFGRYFCKMRKDPRRC